MGRCFFNFSTKQRLRPRFKLLEMHCGRPRDLQMASGNAWYRARESNMASAGRTNFGLQRFHDTKVKLRFISDLLCPFYLWDCS